MVAVGDDEHQQLCLNVLSPRRLHISCTPPVRILEWQFPGASVDGKDSGLGGVGSQGTVPCTLATLPFSPERAVGTS